jgi:tetratricopeptide (TPR) repeat protein
MTGVAGLLLLSPLAADPPSPKPPWQRLLQGEDARQAQQLEQKLAQQQEAGQLKEALETAQALRRLREKGQGADHWQTVDARWSTEALARVCKQGKEAGQQYAQSGVLQRQAATLLRQGRSREARPLLEKVLLIRRKLLGEEHPLTAQGYNDLGYGQSFQGQYTQAEESFRTALAICRRVLGEDHPDTATCYNNIALNQQE